MKTVFYNINDGNIMYVIDGVQDLTNVNDDSLQYIVVSKEELPFKQHSKFKVIDNQLVKKSENELNPYDINIEKERLIQLSKTLLSLYLENNPLLFSDSKYYSVTQEKQSLLNNAITVYQMKTQLGLPAELKWNSTGEECSVWTIEDIIPLALGVASYVEPLVSYQQSIEVQIRNCTTREELESIVIDYATV